MDEPSWQTSFSGVALDCDSCEIAWGVNGTNGKKSAAIDKTHPRRIIVRATISFSPRWL